jgi:hypothetical protein
MDEEASADVCRCFSGEEQVDRLISHLDGCNVAYRRRTRQKILSVSNISQGLQFALPVRRLAETLHCSPS